jgi:two-component system, NarL family, sensor kinase
MLSRLVMRAAPLVVALAVIALLPTVALLGRLGLLTDPMVLAFFVLVLGFLAVGLVTTVRRVGNPIGWLLLWQGVIAGLSLLSAAYGMYDLQVAAEPLPGGSLLLWTSTWIWLAALAVSPVIHVLFPDGRLLSRRWAGVIWLAWGRWRWPWRPLRWRPGRWGDRSCWQDRLGARSWIRRRPLPS